MYLEWINAWHMIGGSPSTNPKKKWSELANPVPSYGPVSKSAIFYFCVFDCISG